MNHTSVFDTNFDVAVYGGGYAAFAAAWSLSAGGKKVLLFTRHSGLLWESGDAFADRAGEPAEMESMHAHWERFLDDMGRRNLNREGKMDPAGAQVVSCAWVRNAREQLKMLFNAWPVGGVRNGEGLSSVAVATKSGTRILRAKNWIDASDEAELIRLVAPGESGRLRRPSRYEQRAVLICEGEEEAIPETAASKLPDGVRLEKRLWKHEFALCFSSATPLGLSELAQRAFQARNRMGAPFADACITHFSLRPYPVYESETDDETPEPPVRGNLISASPADVRERIVSLADRFHLGLRAASAAAELPEVSASGERISLGWEETVRDCGVLVAGAGTGGSVAALTASREGADVLIVDPMPFAGGIGSGGLINSYFHGQPGGFFEEYDRCAERIRKKLDPSGRMSAGWHHESKKIAFEDMIGSAASSFLRESLIYEVRGENGRILEVRAAIPCGIVLIRPKAVIDATGDGDVAALAGAAYVAGRKGDGLPLSYSQPCMRVVPGRSATEIRGANFDVGWVDATDPEDLTRARLTGVTRYLRDRYTDEEHLLLIAPVLGIRQSRHFLTEDTVDLDDILQHRKRANRIGTARSPLDTHSVDFEFEDDETLFWLWGCKNFRGIAYGDMPYGMMIPKGWKNVWLACRAAGVTPSAAYAVRMQRDMQRMGEAAAYAASAVARDGGEALSLSPEVWRAKLSATGAGAEYREEDERTEDPLVQLDGGEPSGYLWMLYKNRDRFGPDVRDRLRSPDRPVSWLAAVLLSMWGEPGAESRLLAAIASREEGGPTPDAAKGAFGQLIDVPHWFLAVCLLRRCGTAASLPLLAELASQPRNPLNLRTAIGLTIERIASRLKPENRYQAKKVLLSLMADNPPDAYVRPSRSIDRALRGGEQLPLTQEPPGVDTREDHGWQLRLAVHRAAHALGFPSPVDITADLCDERALVRKAFVGS